MILKKIRYSEWLGKQQEWILEEMQLSQRNLFVGKNATGKSRVLSLISALAGLLSGGPLMLSGDWEAEFESGDSTYRYSLQLLDDTVVEERLLINGEEKFSRDSLGRGHIFTTSLNSSLEFRSPPSMMVAVSRRDSLQHPYLEPLHEWASGFKIFRFGSSVGKDLMSFFAPSGPPVNENDPNQIVGIFRNAIRDFGDVFHDALLADLASVGYDIERVFLGAPISLRVSAITPPSGGEISSLCVKERDLAGITDQHSMSQGMWRALTLLIWLNYFALKKTAACCAIDDIGEGLDFERSCKLIALIRQKSEENSIQLLMSTNDKNIMDGVPLDEWEVLVRSGPRVSARNHQNSPDIFEDFRFTGLSNFSFFELDVLNNPPNL